MTYDDILYYTVVFFSRTPESGYGRVNTATWSIIYDSGVPIAEEWGHRGRGWGLLWACLFLTNLAKIQWACLFLTNLAKIQLPLLEPRL